MLPARQRLLQQQESSTASRKVETRTERDSEHAGEGRDALDHDDGRVDTAPVAVGYNTEAWRALGQ